MTRAQRRWHFFAWTALGPLLALGLLAALAARRPAHPVQVARGAAAQSAEEAQSQPTPERRP